MFQNPKWEEILENTARVSKNCSQLVEYVQNQLLNAAQTFYEKEKKLASQVEWLKADGVS